MQTEGPDSERNTTSPEAEEEAQSGGEGRDIRFVLTVTLLVSALVGVLGFFAGKRAAAEERPAPHASEPELSFVERGQRIFETKGCVRCHGQHAAGGVPNPNSVLGTIPALNGLADKMGPFEREDATKAIALLEKHQELENITQAPFPRFTLFKAQHRALRQLIWSGNTPGAKNPSLPPPAPMPSWRGDLKAGDINAILAYVISQYPWDEEEEESTTADPAPAETVAPAPSDVSEP